MNWPFAVVMLVLLGACQREPGAARTATVNALTRQCRNVNGLKALKVDCGCLMNNVTADMSDDELALWVNEPTLFSEQELGTLISRKAIVCLRGAIVSECAKGGASGRCECIVDGFLAKFSGDELMDVLERFRNGGAIPAAANDVRARCLAGGR
jgi:hypothetical protein